ncbi:MAG: sulfatase-like hydrolase/transferase [Bdellovibrionia bacterium]
MQTIKKTIKKTLSFSYLLFIFFLSSCTSFPTYLVPETPFQNITVEDTNKNVIWITLDGIRWQDFFYGTDEASGENGEPLKRFKVGSDRKSLAFKDVHRRLESSGVAFGDADGGAPMRISNPTAVSLPAYQSMFTGVTHNCFSNSCSWVPIETVQERVLRLLKLRKEQVVTLASWSKIAQAVERREGGTNVNAGALPWIESFSPSKDLELEALNQTLIKKGSGGDVRLDEDTMALSTWYLKKYRPRLLTISLNDADEFAHSNKREAYRNTLRRYDQFIESILQILESWGEEGKSTLILVTTDHGRGYNGRWTDHGSSTPGSDQIWMAALGPSLRKGIASSNVYQHNDLVPTVHAILGIQAESCAQCGRVISELVDVVLR